MCNNDICNDLTTNDFMTDGFIHLFDFDEVYNSTRNESNTKFIQKGENSSEIINKRSFND